MRKEDDVEADAMVVVVMLEEDEDARDESKSEEDKRGVLRGKEGGSVAIAADGAGG